MNVKYRFTTIVPMNLRIKLRGHGRARGILLGCRGIGGPEHRMVGIHRGESSKANTCGFGRHQQVKVVHSSRMGKGGEDPLHPRKMAGGRSRGWG